MKLIMTVILGCGALLAGGCQSGMDIPAGFVPVEVYDPHFYQARAISADGVVLALRRGYDNPKNGTLEFWGEAIKNQLTSSEGYKLTKDEPVKSQTGRAGKLLTFSTDRRGTNLTYLLAIFVTEQKVVLAEAGGKADAVKGKMDAIKKALLSVKLTP